jgi:hypothetical protein
MGLELPSRQSKIRQYLYYILKFFFTELIEEEQMILHTSHWTTQLQEQQTSVRSVRTVFNQQTL